MGCNDTRKNNSIEQATIRVLAEKGEEGILQPELWRKLRVESKQGLRVLQKMEKRCFIRREKELHDGRWVYRIYPKRLPQQITSIVDCPCFMCEESSRCDETCVTSPISCKKLTEWLMNLAGQPDVTSETTPQAKTHASKKKKLK